MHRWKILCRSCKTFLPTLARQRLGLWTPQTQTNVPRCRCKSQSLQPTSSTDPYMPQAVSEHTTSDDDNKHLFETGLVPTSSQQIYEEGGRAFYHPTTWSNQNRSRKHDSLLQESKTHWRHCLSNLPLSEQRRGGKYLPGEDNWLTQSSPSFPSVCSAA